jgi:hypothetical protein
MLSFWSLQVADWGCPSRLALWSSEAQNRQLAGVHLDFDTAGPTWAEQARLSPFDDGFHSEFVAILQYSRTEILRFWNDTYEEDMGVSAAPSPQGLFLDKGDAIAYLNELEVTIPGMLPFCLIFSI